MNKKIAGKSIKIAGRILPSLLPIESPAAKTKAVTKTSRQIVDLLKGVWWFPQDLYFRQAFTEMAIQAIQHGINHHDLTKLNSLIIGIPDVKWSGEIRKTLSTYIDAQIEPSTNRLYWANKKTRPTSLPDRRLDLFTRGPKYKSSGVILGNLEFSISEFVDEVTDLLVLHRNKLEDEHIDQLALPILQLVERQKKRQLEQDIKSEEAISKPTIDVTIKNNGNTEELNARSFKTTSDARTRIDDFIANIYNTERLHSALGYRSPLEFETAFAQNKPK